MEISAKEVMALRQKTGAGVMDCKKALKDAEGDVDKAINILREKGLARARKRDDKVAEEGVVISYLSDNAKLGVLLEVNCETDFVAKTDDFINFTNSLLHTIVENKPDNDGWKALNIAGSPAETALHDLSALLGEKMEMRRYQIFDISEGLLDIYIHGEGRLGVMLDFGFAGDEDKAKEIAHDLCMQIAAANPLAVARDQVPQEAINEELEIYRQQARNEGKPDNIVDRIAEGKLNKYFSEVCLLDQPFVKEQKQVVKEYLQTSAQESGTKVEPKRFVRFALGGN